LIRGERVVFILKHDGGSEECSVSIEALLGLVHRNRANTSDEELEEIFYLHTEQIEEAAREKLARGAYSLAGILVMSWDLEALNSGTEQNTPSLSSGTTSPSELDTDR